jgi:hypothetical protein
MSTTSMSRDDRVGGRTLAEWFCLVGGAALVLAGLFGFIADATFDTGSAVQGDSFLGFEVNGWHNLVHILTGLFLLTGAKNRHAAKRVALIFGIVYGAVTIYGLIDGNSVLGILPVNPADNVLHLVLSVAAIAASLLTPDRDEARTGLTRASDSAHDATGRTGRFERTATADRTESEVTTRPRH